MFLVSSRGCMTVLLLISHENKFAGMNAHQWCDIVGLWSGSAETVANTVQLYLCLSSEVISLIIDWTVILRGSAKASAFIIARCTEGSTDYLLNQKSGQVLAQALLVLFVAYWYIYFYVLHKESRERAWNISPLVHCGSTHFVFASCWQSCLVDCRSTGYCSVQAQGVPEWPQWTTVSPVSMVVLVLWTWPYRKVDYTGMVYEDAPAEFPWQSLEIWYTSRFTCFICFNYCRLIH